jgi:hypothetical protein
MTNPNLSRLFVAVKRTTVAMFAVLWVFSGVALAQGINLTLQDGPLTILKGNSVTKRINGIPQNTPGLIHLRIKWHAMTFIPNTFNKLKIELLHGSRVLDTNECYSVHADKNPLLECYVSEPVTQAEADASGDWKLRVTNNSDHDVNGFNILKEATDLNPAVTSIVSTFESDCSTRYLSMPSGEVDLAPYSTAERRFFGITNQAGELRVKAKWHVAVVLPNVFNRLKIEVLDPNDNVVKTSYCYSIHSDQRNKCDIRHNVGAGQLGNVNKGWRLRISNEEASKVNNFGIEKGNDLNPFVPSFRSTYKPSCN